jgi:hypothetical protein
MYNQRNDIIMILDESGSMESLHNEPIVAMNSFISEQKTTGSIDSTISLWKFNNQPTLVFDNIPLSSVGEFTDFNPSGTTALYDAIGMAIDNKKDSFDVTCVVITDGYNNSSVLYNANKVTDMVSTQEKEKGWVFHFLGANQDSVNSGNSIGIKKCSNYIPIVGSENGLVSILRKTSSDIHNHRSGNPSNSRNSSIDIENTPTMMPILNRYASQFININLPIPPEY